MIEPRRSTRRRRVAALAVLPALALALPACGAVDKVKDEVNNAVGDAASGVVLTQVRDELKQAGIDLKSGPECSDSSDGGGDTSINIVCTGETTDGEQVRGNFKASIDGTNCSGSISLKVGDKDVIPPRTLNPCRGG
jgi:hypothetical protein